VRLRHEVEEEKRGSAGYRGLGDGEHVFERGGCPVAPIDVEDDVHHDLEDARGRCQKKAAQAFGSEGQPADPGADRDQIDHGHRQTIGDRRRAMIQDPACDPVRSPRAATHIEALSGGAPQSGHSSPRTAGNGSGADGELSVSGRRRTVIETDYGERAGGVTRRMRD